MAVDIIRINPAKEINEIRANITVLPTGNPQSLLLKKSYQDISDIESKYDDLFEDETIIVGG